MTILGWAKISLRRSKPKTVRILSVGMVHTTPPGLDITFVCDETGERLRIEIEPGEWRDLADRMADIQRRAQ